MALIQGSRLAGVDSVRFPVLLAITCLDNSDVTKRSTIYFVDAATGDVVKTMLTRISGVTAAPANGWAHLVNRPDKGDLLGCGSNGAIYSIDYNQFNTTVDGTATLLPRPAGLSSSCGALGWDPEEDMIYQGLVTGGGQIDVAKFADGTTTLLATVNTPCRPSGLAVTGGVLVIAATA